MKNENIEFNLPFFPGFYNSHLGDEQDWEERYIDFESHNEDIWPLITDKNLELFYSSDFYGSKFNEFTQNASNEFVEKFNELCKEEIGFKNDIVNFKAVNSPKEYNFETDACTCEITLNHVKALFTLVNNDKEEFQEFLKENYGSRDGFISFFELDFSKWVISEDFAGRNITAMLNFLLKDTQKEHWSSLEGETLEYLSGNGEDLASYRYSEYCDFIESLKKAA